MSNKPRAMRDSLLEKIHSEMKDNKDIFFVTADFGSPVLDKIRLDFPNQFVNVGIAEQNLINVSAGLAIEGHTVFAYAIAPFITMRCFEQIRVNLALLSKVRKLNVNLIGVGAGYSYVVSGPTHQCYEDLSLMRAIPNMSVFSPSDEYSASNLLNACLSKSGPKYIRLDAQILPKIYEHDYTISNTGFEHLIKGQDYCLLSTGFMTHTALLVSKEILSENGAEIGVIDLVDITDFDHDAMLEVLSRYKKVISVEEGFKNKGGLDVKILSLLNENSIDIEFESCGVEGGYCFEIGTREQLHEQVGLGVSSIKARLARSC